MKTTWILGAMAAVIAARAESAETAITVYTSSDPAVPVAVLQRAEVVAARIFAEAGMNIEWRIGRPRISVVGREAEALAIRLEAGIPTGPHSGALAFTAPEEGGVMIHVFYYRVRATYRPDLVHVLLGYVLAHEMGHVLEGISRHSEDGVMKAFWTAEDYRGMAAGRLRFAPVDATMMLKRLAITAAQAKLAETR